MSRPIVRVARGDIHSVTDPLLDLLAADDLVLEVRTYADGRITLGEVLTADELWERWKRQKG
jgi:hypothetical protein